jgi:hypothetical protein
MKNDSSSPMQKASFVLLLLILGCLVYLIARDAFRPSAARGEVNAAGNPATRPVRAGTWNEAVPPSSFTPLREREPVPPLHAVSNVQPRIVSRPVPGIVSTAPPDGDRPTRTPVLPVVRAVERTPETTPDFGGFAGHNAGAVIAGRAFLRGAPPAETRIVFDAQCGRLAPRGGATTQHYLVSAEAGLGNVFIYIKSGAPAAAAAATPPVLDQVGCQYTPYVMGVQTGQVFNVRNSDPVLHNVHPLPKNNRERNVGQPVRGMVTPFVFERAEVLVKFKCDVHPWMFAHVGVVDHPWFAVTDKNGFFTLPAGLPAGQYTLAAVHQKAGELTQEITVQGGDVQPVSFTFDVPPKVAATP